MNSSSVKNFLIILCGIPFAGKTYLAKKLASDLKGDRVDLDEKFILISNLLLFNCPHPYLKQYWEHGKLSHPTTIPSHSRFSTAISATTPGIFLDDLPTVSPTPTSDPAESAVCTMDAKVCSDGSYVGRAGPNCEFAPCPRK